MDLRSCCQPHNARYIAFSMLAKTLQCCVSYGLSGAICPKCELPYPTLWRGSHAKDRKKQHGITALGRLLSWHTPFFCSVCYPRQRYKNSLRFPNRTRHNFLPHGCARPVSTPQIKKSLHPHGQRLPNVSINCITLYAAI